MRWAPWEAARRCNNGAQPGATALWDWIEATWTGLYRFGGIYNCRPVRGASSMSVHSEGRAVDAMIRPVGGKGDRRGYDLVGLLGANGEQLGVQCVIFDRTIWTRKSPDGRRYNGQHPHYDHLHIELTRQAAATLDVGRIRAIAGGRLPARPRRRTLRLTSPMMRGADVAQLQAAIGARPDGVFGPATRQRVIAFQRSARLNPDGIVGARTWEAAGF